MAPVRDLGPYGPRHPWSERWIISVRGCGATGWRPRRWGWSWLTTASDEKANLTVDEGRRQATLAHLKDLHQRYPALNLIDLEFCEANDSACRRAVAKASTEAGLTPFVSDPKLATVGIGRIEVMPRRVLVVQSLEKGDPIENGTGARVLSMPFD